MFSELKINIEKDIEERILSEFGEVADAEVSLDVDEEWKLQGVKHIGVEIENVPAGLTERLKEIYGCESVEFRYK